MTPSPALDGVDAPEPAIPAVPVPGDAAATAAPARGSLLRRALTAAACLAAAGALARLLITADLRAVSAMIGGAGPIAFVAMVPIAAQVALEAGSWRLLLGRLGRAIPFHVAYRINLRADAIRLSFPAGSPLADGLRPVLFARHRSVTMSDAGTSLVVRKLCHMAGQGIFLVVGGAIGSSLFMRWADRLGPVARVAPVLCCAFGAALVLIAALLALTAFRGSIAGRMESFLGRVTRGRASAFLARRRAGCASLDATLDAISRERRCLAWNLLAALGGYALDAVETVLMLWLLGVHVGLGEAIALEGVISVVRSMAFAVPGGIGIQDLSYRALLMGTVGDSAAMGLVLLKRARDVLWVATGWLAPMILGRIGAEEPDTSIAPAPAGAIATP